jgi:inorganic pyrophosphatase/exopolyphosphatase
VRVVTSGRRYMDIDAYASCIAYAELLSLHGYEAEAISTAPLNGSISPITRSWKVQFLTHYQPRAEDTFTVIDVSDPSQLSAFVDVERVEEVIDHHPGFEDYWSGKKDVKAQLEFIGAACTQIYERWVAANLLERMSESSARLLVCGILDNTLNFGAEITLPRDKAAYETLVAKAGLPVDWPARYFTDCETAMLDNVSEAVRNDTKVLRFCSFPSPLRIGQLVVWDSRPVLERHEAIIKAELTVAEPNWFMNLISLKDRRSYFITEDPATQAWLSKLLDVHFTGSLAIANRPWLRKEITGQDIVRHSTVR